MHQPRNLGVIQYVTGGNAASYKDATGATRAAATNLSAVAWRRSDVVQAGRGERLALTVFGALGGGQSAKIRLERLYADVVGNDGKTVVSGVTWPWSPVAAARLDGSAAPAAENVVLAADLTGVDGLPRAVSIGTENLGPSGSFSVVVETANAAAAGDAVVVACELL